MAQRWNPITVLNIVESRIMCCGFAPSKNRDCHNQVAASSRLEALGLLAKLAAFPPSSNRVLPRLNQIARCLLCKDRHQDQAESVVDGWREKINDFVQSHIEPQEEDSDADDAASGEHTVDVREQLVDVREQLVDVREQLVECQRLLTRVVTALESHQGARREFETFSVGSDTSTDTVRAQSSVETETPRSESTRGDAEAEPAAEPLTTGLNLDHVQTLVRRLTMEHEANRLRRSRTVRFEEDAASPASSTASSQTLMPGEPNPEPQVPQREQRVEEQIESPAIAPEVEGRNDTSDGHPSSEDTNPITTVITETENGQSGNDVSPLSAMSTIISRDRSNGACDEVSHPRQLRLSRRYANPMWLAAVALYLGVLFAWYRLRVLQNSGVRRLTLDGPVTHQIGRMAE
ncbi:MAG: hypothetical protein Q9195_005550 [Heterodermia aff. obscurata]